MTLYTTDTGFCLIMNKNLKKKKTLLTLLSLCNRRHWWSGSALLNETWNPARDRLTKDVCRRVNVSCQWVVSLSGNEVISANTTTKNYSYTEYIKQHGIPTVYLHYFTSIAWEIYRMYWYLYFVHFYNPFPAHSLSMYFCACYCTQGLLCIVHTPLKSISISINCFLPFILYILVWLVCHVQYIPSY